MTDQVTACELPSTDTDRPQPERVERGRAEPSTSPNLGTHLTSFVSVGATTFGHGQSERIVLREAHPELGVRDLSERVPPRSELMFSHGAAFTKAAARFIYESARQYQAVSGLATAPWVFVAPR